MTGNFQPAPLGLENAIGTDKEGAPLDALDLFAIHDLVFDDTEHVAHFLFGVSDEIKRQLEFGLELVMRLHVVPRHTEDRGACLDEFLVFIAELHSLCGATRCIVLWVEVHHHHVAEVRRIRKFETTGRVGVEFGEGFVDNDRHELIFSVVSPRSGGFLVADEG